jgi:hypothetical protein
MKSRADDERNGQIAQHGQDLCHIDKRLKTAYTSLISGKLSA